MIRALPGRMLPAWMLLGLLGAAMAHAEPQIAAGADPAPSPQAGRAIAAEFQQALGGRLKAAMAAGGPVNAIDVCAIQAPAIAARLSAATGTAVSRTALRVRNPGNAPDPQAAAVLHDFSGRLAAAEAMPIEHFAPRPDGGMRYLQAIVMQPLCLTCHGGRLTPAVTEALAIGYPDDRATGFEVGELRGAFLIDWPAPAPETLP